jgi:hypothetical protein
MGRVRLLVPALASLLLAAPAAADERDPLALEWTAPKECPPGSVVRARALERIPANSAGMFARGRVMRAQGRYRLALEIEARGDRVLEASTCDALASSAAVVLAMSAAPSEPPAPAPLPPAPPPPATEEPDEPLPRDVPREVFNLRAHVIHDTGILPSHALGGGFAFGADPIAHLHLEVAASLFAAQNGYSEIDSTRGARFSMMSLDARACWGLTQKDELAACLGIDVMSVKASGIGNETDLTYDANAIAWGPDVGLAVRIPLAKAVALRISASVFMPTAREAFAIRGLGRLHRPEAVVFRTFVGPEVRF